MARKTKTKDFKVRVEEAVKKEIGIYENAGVAKRIMIHYPHSKKTPMLGRLGEWLLRGSRAEVTTQYIDKLK